MNRREMLTSVGGVGVAGSVTTMAGLASASENMAGHAAGHAAAHHGGGVNQALINSALDCMKTAEICINHCLDVLGTGDTSLAECGKVVQELETICSSLFKFASYDSKYLNGILAVAKQVCTDCEKECRKHKKHQSCLDCADACVACLKECDLIKA